MNIYLMTEDDQNHCVKGKTMKEAIDFCRSAYLEEMKEHFGDQYDEHHESKYYHDEILQSCSLVGRLVN